MPLSATSHFNTRLDILLLVSALASVFYFFKHPLDVLINNGYRFPVHFLAGAIFYFWSFPLNLMVALALFLLAGVSLVIGIYPIVSAPITVYIFFWFATVLPFQKFFRDRDYSYGVYIYAWIVQQTLSAYNLNQFPFIIYFLLSIVGTFPLAIISWHLVEKPSLKLKNIFDNTNS
jgi:peptidoglycan/LPS O-acetylase OafA/YrhL